MMMSVESPRCIITKGAVLRVDMAHALLLLLLLQHEQPVEIIHPPSHLSLSLSLPVPHFDLPPLFITLAFFIFYFFFVLLCICTDRHTHTGSLYLSSTSSSVSLPFIHEQGTVLFSVFSSVHHWIISLHLSCLFDPSGESAAAGPHRVQPEGQEGPPEAWKGEHCVSALLATVTVSLSKHSSTLFCNAT